MKYHRTLVMFHRLAALGSLGLTAVPLVILPSSPPPAPAQYRLDPPGDCTTERHRVLQDAVRTECDKRGEMRCLNTDECPAIEGKIFLIEACIAARVKIDTECFRGGDPEHHTQIRQRRNGLDNCNKLLAKKMAAKECRIQVCPVPK
jgi:hypothetical protein